MKFGHIRNSKNHQQPEPDKDNAQIGKADKIKCSPTTSSIKSEEIENSQ